MKADRYCSVEEDMQQHMYGNLSYPTGSMPKQKQPPSINSAGHQGASGKDSVKSGDTADVVGRYSEEVAVPTAVMFPVHNKSSNFQVFRMARPHMRAFHYCESIRPASHDCGRFCMYFFACSFTAHRGRGLVTYCLQSVII